MSTGTSTIVAVEHLVNEKHVPEDHIMILVLVTCPESIEAMNNAFPNVKIVSAALDSHLDPETGRIVPGLGDFGARYAYQANGRGDDEDEEEGGLRRESLERALHESGALDLDYKLLKKSLKKRGEINIYNKL